MATVATTRPLKRLYLVALLLFSSVAVITASNPTSPVDAATQSVVPGSFIIDMGATQGRTIATGALKGYGAVYDLLVNDKVPVQWVIEPSKAPKKPTAASVLVDSVDFTFDPGT